MSYRNTRADIGIKSPVCDLDAARVNPQPLPQRQPGDFARNEIKRRRCRARRERGREGGGVSDHEGTRLAQ